MWGGSRTGGEGCEMTFPLREHGSTDALGPVRWDFSSNANACGPCPQVLQAVQQADARRYPDPSYSALRQALACLHGVAPHRILLASSASEWIQRLTGWAALHRRQAVWWPRHAYGDYAHAAAAWGLPRTDDPTRAALGWLCDPSSPLGQNEEVSVIASLMGQPDAMVALDCAYQPLRLEGEPALSADQLQRGWQVWSPNKALGMTGVRAAYVVAPEQARTAAMQLDAMAASWPIGCHGVALLAQWSQPEVQDWVRNSLQTLRAWKKALVHDLTIRGWQCQPSHTPYFCARPPCLLQAEALRSHGVKLRDATSFSLPGWWRLSAQPDDAREALTQALDAITPTENRT
jgi:histidinol-phosphate aminotransferase